MGWQGQVTAQAACEAVQEGMYDGMGVQPHSANVLTGSLAAHLGLHLTVNIHGGVGQAVCARGKLTFRGYSAQ